MTLNIYQWCIIIGYAEKVWLTNRDSVHITPVYWGLDEYQILFVIYFTVNTKRGRIYRKVVKYRINEKAI